MASARFAHLDGTALLHVGQSSWEDGYEFLAQIPLLVQHPDINRAITNVILSGRQNHCLAGKFAVEGCLATISRPV
jgi:hypothetical protein